MSRPRLKLFAAHGVEIEYMIVSADRLDVRPITDELLKAVCGSYVSDFEKEPIAWSNELVTHVVELKTHRPAPDLLPLAAEFQSEVREINRLLSGMGARLMGTAMHPWMDPFRETRLWPHEYSPIYQAYDRIFDCRGHGWSNLQSVHLNLPFANDEEFGRLHAAIRLVLPLLPGLAASSPFQDSKATGFLDNRLENYRVNSARIPSITAAVIPEPVYTEAAYRRDVFQRMYDDIAPLDPEGVLQDEFLNARGAIARFDRGSIEIRLLDTQECPQADLAIVGLVSAVLRALTGERWSSLAEQQAFPTEPLAALLREAIRQGNEALVTDISLQRLLGWNSRTAPSLRELWQHLAFQLWPSDSAEAHQWRPALDVIFRDGCLARRILRLAGENPDRTRLTAIYAQLCDCLAEGRMFESTGV
ncbi:MAG: glutamate--cysteine ligase [Verrucomicrobiales bacterium]|nr:glutamate--cysteine ligase [Verrucomicrobiales bacterium]